MALSEREKELLAQLEKQLNDDPAFASTMTGPQAVAAPALIASPRHLVLGALGAVIGLGIIIVGVASKLIIVGVLGFLLASAGVYFATSTPGNSSSQKVSESSLRKKPKEPSNFMKNLEEKWDRRQGGSRF